MVVAGAGGEKKTFQTFAYEKKTYQTFAYEKNLPNVRLCGADDRIRTCNLLITNQLLYHWVTSANTLVGSWRLAQAID